MDLDQLKQILTLVQQHGVAELELEQAGLRIRVRKDTGTPAAAVGAAATLPHAAATLAVPPTGPSPATVDGDIELAVVKSPIVGTFYRSPEPGAPAFVEVGAAVRKGQVLCIIEAMKLMNEIDSEYDGEVVTVYVENGQPVQYGERLFAIRTK
ncbi:MAG: acetyl-CoA carboxylase biotin carboxyl carrier protein [Vicinamibacterales bacterium]